MSIDGALHPVALAQTICGRKLQLQRAPSASGAFSDRALHRSGTEIGSAHSHGMKKRLSKVEIVEEGDERFLLKVYDNGLVEKMPIVREEKTTKRLSSKIAWYRDLRTGRRIFY